MGKAKIGLIGFGTSHFATEESRDQLLEETKVETSYFRLRSYPFNEELVSFIDEYAFEYVKRFSPKWRMYAGIEVEQAERAFILEIQYFITDRMFLKFNNGFPLSKEAPDVAPEFGILMSF